MQQMMAFMGESMKGRQCRDGVARQASGHATAGREGGREGGLGECWPGGLAAGEWEIAWAQLPVTLEKSDFHGARAGWLAGRLAGDGSGAEKTQQTRAVQQVGQADRVSPPFWL